MTNAMYRQAYLVFSSNQKLEDAVKKFKRERTRLDDRRLILIRWNPLNVLPNGILIPCLFSLLCTKWAKFKNLAIPPYIFYSDSEM